MSAWWLALTMVWSAGQPATWEAFAREADAAYPDAPTISAAAAVELGSKLTFVDVRSEAERAVSIIPGALRLDQLPAAATGQVVIVYCTVGVRSGAATEDLITRGFQARNLRGGVLAWTAEGGAMVDASGKPTRRVHVYGKPWAKLPKGYEAVW